MVTDLKKMAVIISLSIICLTGVAQAATATWNTSPAPNTNSWTGTDNTITIGDGVNGSLYVPQNVTITINGSAAATGTLYLYIGGGAKIIWTADIRANWNVTSNSFLIQVNGGNNQNGTGTSSGELHITSGTLQTFDNRLSTIQIAGGTGYPTVRVSGGTIKNGSNCTGQSISSQGDISASINTNRGDVIIEGNAVLQNDGNSYNYNECPVIRVTGPASNTITIKDNARVYNAAGPAIYQAGTSIVNIEGGYVGGGGWNYTQYGTQYYRPVIHTGSSATLNISGGKVENENYNSVDADAILVNSQYCMPKINISGGMVQAGRGASIKYDCPSSIAISGGTVFGYGSTLTDVIKYASETSGPLKLNDPSGTGAVIAWQNRATPFSYYATQSTDLSIWPQSAKATWNFSEQGFTNTVNAQVIKLDGVSVLNDAPTTPTASNLYFSIPTGHIYSGEPQGIGTVTPQSIVEGKGLGAITVYYAGASGTTYPKSSTAPTNAGTYAVTADIAEGHGYAAATGLVLGTYAIGKKSVTITGLSAENKVYDGNATAIITGTAEISGNIDGANLEITGTRIAAFADKYAGTGKTVTFSGYNLGGSAADNYTLSAQPANVTANITPKPVTITGLSAEDKVYDGNEAATATGTAVISGNLDGTDLTVVYGTAVFANSNVGTGITVTFSGYNLGGSAADNYTLSAQPASVTANITIAPGQAVSAPASTTAITGNNITIAAVAAPIGQTVEYAISENSTLDNDNWQDGLTFVGLTQNTTYYIFARSKENTNYTAGTPSAALEVTTLNPQPPAITATTLASGTVGEAYSQTLTATGDDPITWSVESGNLPNGLTLNANGTIAGTPTVAGTFDFTVKASNEVGSVTKDLSVEIEEDSSTPILATFAPQNLRITLMGNNLHIDGVGALRIYNLKGNIVLSKSVTSNETISIAHLPKGVYMVNVAGKTVKVVR